MHAGGGRGPEQQCPWKSLPRSSHDPRLSLSVLVACQMHPLTLGHSTCHLALALARAERSSHFAAQIGDPAVGKTSLTQMFHSNGQRFPKAYTMTCGVDFSVKAVTVPGTHEAIEFHCFDVGGQDIFEETFGSYCEGAKAVVLVYDVTRGHTLEACGNWYAKLLEVLNVDGLPGALVANKVDLRERTAVNRQQGQQMAGSMHLSYFETSALDGHATDEPFIELAKAFASGGMAS